MLTHRRCARPLALVCTTAAVAFAPAAAQARPAPLDPPITVDRQAAAQEAPQPVIREIHTGGDSTLALIISGSALLIAAGGAALSGRDHRRIGRIA